MPKPLRGKTVFEMLHPEAPEEMIRTAKDWVADSSHVMLSLVWAAYDRIAGDPRQVQAIVGADEDLERGIAKLLFLTLDDVMTRNEPFQLLSEASEDETRKSRPARPKQYDIAFVMRKNPRIMWSLEAKVLPTPKTLAEYVATLRTRYLTGAYSPYLSEGAMVGFLLSGHEATFFEVLAESLDTELHDSDRWPGRAYRATDHRRDIRSGKLYPSAFRCHHILMKFG